MKARSGVVFRLLGVQVINGFVYQVGSVELEEI